MENSNETINNEVINTSNIGAVEESKAMSNTDIVKNSSTFAEMLSNMSKISNDTAIAENEEDKNSEFNAHEHVENFLNEIVKYAILKKGWEKNPDLLSPKGFPGYLTFKLPLAKAHEIMDLEAGDEIIRKPHRRALRRELDARRLDVKFEPDYGDWVTGKESMMWVYIKTDFDRPELFRYLDDQRELAYRRKQDEKKIKEARKQRAEAQLEKLNDQKRAMAAKSSQENFDLEDEIRKAEFDATMAQITDINTNK